MNKEQYSDLVKSNNTDEWEYQKFSVSAVIALIAASWILLEKVAKVDDAGILLQWSICLGVGFLFLRGVRQFLNIRHNRKILDDESDAEKAGRKSQYLDSCASQTGWGRTSAWLYPLEPLILLTAFVVFATDAFRILVR